MVWRINMNGTVTVTYNCPNCGAELYFNSDKQKLCCEFCESEFTGDEIEATGAGYIKDQKAKADAEYCDHINEYTCTNCGAEISVDENTAAGICIYCDSPVILKGKLSGQMIYEAFRHFRFDLRPFSKLP